MAENQNGNTNGPVYKSETVIEVKDNEDLPGVSSLVVRKLEQQEGSKSPVKYHVKVMLKLEGGGEIEAPRSMQVLFRNPLFVRPPQSRDDTTGVWSNDTSFPAHLQKAAATRAIGMLLVNGLGITVHPGV